MTRKDFELIARTILDLPTMTQGEISPILRISAARQFAHALRRTNARFDEERFLKTCGLLP